MNKTSAELATELLTTAMTAKQIHLQGATPESQVAQLAKLFTTLHQVVQEATDHA